MGCIQSKELVPEDRRKGIGHTERIHRREPTKKEGTKPTPQSFSSEIKEVDKVTPKLDENGHLLEEEVSNRRCSSEKALSVMVGNEEKILVHYAHLSQRGYYPDDPNKANQDTLSVHHNFSGIEGDAHFAVYDGHGPYGDKCAYFAKEQLPKSVTKFIRQERVKEHKLRNESIEGKKIPFNPKLWPMLNSEQYERACHNGHLECNELMVKNVRTSTISGTTSISAAFHGTRLTVCNVGDSRAVLGYSDSNGIEKEDDTSLAILGKEETKEEIEAILDKNESAQDASDSMGNVGRLSEKDLIAIPLSIDQTPWRKDERERLKKAGARIMTIDQLEGFQTIHENYGDKVLGEDVDVDGDPPRIWLQDQDIPGAAFTRSLGDSVVKKVGVNAEPEMFTKELTKEDKILVIASDGVFEFLTNQAVIDICTVCTDPLEACTEIVKASYAKWLQYEDRTDDITVIVLFLDFQ